MRVLVALTLSIRLSDVMVVVKKDRISNQYKHLARILANGTATVICHSYINLTEKKTGEFIADKFFNPGHSFIEAPIRVIFWECILQIAITRIFVLLVVWVVV